MTTEYSIYDTHIADYLSKNVSETVTIGNTGLSNIIRMYDNNAPLNGYFITKNSNILTINEVNRNIPTCVGIGTDIPINTATLHVQGILYTSNIRSYNTNNTIYFNNSNTNINADLSGINNINIQGTSNTIGNGISTLTLGNNTGDQTLILANIPTSQWKITTSYYNLNIYNDYPNAGTFDISRFHINKNGEVGTNLNTFDNGSGNMIISQNIITNNLILSSNLISQNILTNNMTINNNNKLTSQNIVCGCNITSLDLVNNTLSFSMSNTYNVYSCSANSNIQTLNISDDIAGSQAVIFVTATDILNIYGSNIYGSNIDKMEGTPSIKAAHKPLILSTDDTAIITVLSSGTMRFVNCIKYI